MRYDFCYVLLLTLGTATILARLPHNKIAEGLLQLCLCQISPLKVSFQNVLVHILISLSEEFILMPPPLTYSCYRNLLLLKFIIILVFRVISTISMYL